jgi:SAM-dependent methyltransferase
MRHNVRNIVRICSETFDIKEPVLEIGSYQVKGQEDIAELRTFFKTKKYIGCDIRRGNGVDKIENAEKLTFEDNSIGTIIMVDTLEHVKNFNNTMNEIYRVLKKEGIVIITSTMYSPIHNHPSDYWRFTPASLELLLDRFDTKIIGYYGEKRFPHLVFGIGIKSKNKSKYKASFGKFKSKLDEYFKKSKKEKVLESFIVLSLIKRLFLTLTRDNKVNLSFK